MSSMKFIYVIILLLGVKTLEAEISVTRILDCLCTGTPSQPFTLTAEGTAGPFTYAWSGPEEYASTAQNPDDISDAGQYSVVVTNAYGCEVTLEIDIPACPMPSGIEIEILIVYKIN